MDAQPQHEPIRSAPSSSRRQLRSRERRKVDRNGREESVAARTRSNDMMCLIIPQKRRKHSKRSPPPPSCNFNSQIIKALPGHIISNILFRYLDPSPKHLSTIRSVCTSFRAVAKTSFTALNLQQDITRYATIDISKSLMYNMINQFTNLKEVDFSFCNTFDDCHLELLAPMRLRVLRLRGTRISDQGVMSFFEYEKVLKNSELEIPRPTLPLEVLDLSKTKPCEKDKITNKSLLAVAYTCPELKQLSLSMCTGVTDEFLGSVPVFLPKLTVLDVSMSSITSRGCCHLARSPALRKVDISACPGLSGQTIEALVGGKFGDGDVNEVDDEQNIIELLGLTKGSGSVSKLTSIGARFAEGVDSNMLDFLATQAPHLQTLDLRHHRGNGLKKGLFSPMKMSLRKLRQNGVEVAFSRVSGG